MLETLLGFRYKIIQVLGTGGFGQTYIAEDTQRPGHPKCALKQLKPASNNPKSLQVARRLFKTEAEIQQKLAEHDQIPRLLAYFEQNQEFYLVQEFIEGPTLKDELSRDTRLSETQAIALLQDVLGILEFVHAHQVIHRDIKPSNLIRRSSDGKLVLIDFGAVKEIGTQITPDSDRTDFSTTVAIGTQGYMPSEQMVGKPRFCSDIYALGMTTIQALTGLKPSHLPEDPRTSEIIWRDKAEVSENFAAILNKMVRYHFMERYQSVTEVREALQQLTNPPVTLSLPDANPSEMKMFREMSARTGQKKDRSFVALSILALVGLLLGLRQLGAFQSLELFAFDRMVKLRFATRVLKDWDGYQQVEGTDPRLLVVSITDEDIQDGKNWKLSDGKMARAIAQLQRYHPKVIGFELLPTLPDEPGHAELIAQLKNPNVIAGISLGTNKDENILILPIVSPERIGFTDIATDPDGVIRRNLMYVANDKTTIYSFSLRLALSYLAEKNISPKLTPTRELQLDKKVFAKLQANSGGYQTIDDRGYQIMINYRSTGKIAKRISLSQVLKGQIDPKWIKDKIVIIGVTEPIVDEFFYTPYSKSRPINGAFVQAQQVSQILSTVLEDRPLFWYWPEWVEVLWIAGWGIAGGILAMPRGDRSLFLVRITAILLVLFGSGFAIFSFHGWVPLAAPALASVITSASAILMQIYLNKRYKWQTLKQLAMKVLGENTSLETYFENAQHLPVSFSVNGDDITVTSSHLASNNGNGQRLAATATEDLIQTQRVSIETDSGTTTVRDRIDPHQRKRYLVYCTRGQELTVQATEGNVNFNIIAPDGDIIGLMSGCTTQWQGLLAFGGDYTIEVSAPEIENYAINFEVTNRPSAIAQTGTLTISSDDERTY